MKFIFYLLIGFHGLIHLFGFLKAFRISEFNAIKQSISKPIGILWLLAFLLFCLTIYLLIIDNKYWWILGICAITLSQILIIECWQDAKFGTLPNMIILLICIIARANLNFSELVKKERDVMLSKVTTIEETNDIQKFHELPSSVQKWLSNNDILNKKTLNHVYLKQQVKMKLKPDQDKWHLGFAEQYITANPPAFNWSVDLPINPVISIQGRDKMEDGKASMLMKLNSILTVVNEESNPKINESALQRYLAEIVWLPTAALGSNISWEVVNDKIAKATLTYKGTKVTGLFHFNEAGDFEKFITMRFKDTNDNAKRQEWIIEVLENEIINGIKIPAKIKVTWKLENRNWTWLEIELSEVRYDRMEKSKKDKKLN